MANDTHTFDPLGFNSPELARAVRTRVKGGLGPDGRMNQRDQRGRREERHRDHDHGGAHSEVAVDGGCDRRTDQHPELIIQRVERIGGDKLVPIDQERKQGVFSRRKE